MGSSHIKELIIKEEKKETNESSVINDQGMKD